MVSETLLVFQTETRGTGQGDPKKTFVAATMECDDNVAHPAGW